MSQAVWPHLVNAGGGAVVNMSSLAAQRGFSPAIKKEFGTTSSSYYAAKAGVDALTRYMAGVGVKVTFGLTVSGQADLTLVRRRYNLDPDGGHVFEKMFIIFRSRPVIQLMNNRSCFCRATSLDLLAK